MTIRTINRAVRARVQQPPAFGAGEEWKAVDFRWVNNRGKEEIIALSTGNNVNTADLCNFWHMKRMQTEKLAEYGKLTGQGMWRFIVTTLDKKSKAGEGIIPAHCTVSDVTHFFTRLFQRGLHAMLYPSMDHASEMLSYFDDDPRPIPPADQYATLHFVPFYSSPVVLHGSIGVAPNEQMPSWFSGLYWSKRVDYEAVLQTTQPTGFLISSLHSRRALPTQILALDRNHRYDIIGEIENDAPDGGGFYPDAHGNFSSHVSAHDLALIACKLACQDRFLTLVPDADAKLDSETVLLMSAFAPHLGFENTSDFG
jgi:hypothetical protein